MVSSIASIGTSSCNDDFGRCIVYQACDSLLWQEACSAFTFGENCHTICFVAFPYE